VKVNGKEYGTAWDPWRPESFIIREHYHRVIVHLTQAQQDYMWEAVKADKEAEPVGRPLGWKGGREECRKIKSC
jgi:hypothetical protein